MFCIRSPGSHATKTAVPMKAKSLCFGRVQTKHCEKPSTLKEIQRHTVQGVLDPNATPSTEGALPRLQHSPPKQTTSLAGQVI